ncbi:uncharacterized protein LOC116851047 [Odontomachus brunneus]|uniref:uncharacterized protein LOC116851047 n=1 Tax=Odontomachus brunneus TaxID=486640 RepID=UPI0013F18136|nr:uncharacterized protein LOC116851047 [Odontomachus brunneus]
MSIDFDASYTGLLLDDWIGHLQEVLKDEQSIDKNGMALKFQMIQQSMVEAAFKIGELMEVSSQAKYMAIILYDDYMHKHFRQRFETEITTNNQLDQQFDKISNSMASKAKLSLMSCFQLACKMESAYAKLPISEVIDILNTFDKNTTYTREMIIASEFEVFEAVGFKIPLKTPLSCVELLLAAVNCNTPEDYELGQILLDIAFLQYEKLYTQFRVATTAYTQHAGFKESTNTKSNILFLSAAVVACTSLMRHEQKAISIAMTLAEKTSTEVTDIMIMSSQLFDLATTK